MFAGGGFGEETVIFDFEDKEISGRNSENIRKIGWENVWENIGEKESDCR